MKILQVTNKVPFPPRDGGAIASLTLARELSKAGHEVVVLAMNTPKHFADPEDPSLRPKEKIQWEIVPVNTQIRLRKLISNLLFSKLPYNAVRFRSNDFRVKLLSLLSENKFDFIILENLYTGLYLNDIRSHTDTPVILRAHNIEHEIWERMAKSSKGIKRIYLSILARRIRRFELSLINRYDALVPITERDAEKFKALGNTKPCHVIPTGKDLTEQPVDDSIYRDVTVAHLGALDWLPNQNGILWFIRQVWPIVRRQIPGIEFHLAGRNAPGLFAAGVSAPGVVFHGEIADAGAFIREHTIFIVPLFSGSGMRIKLLDYLSAGKPTVTTTIGAEGIPVKNKKDTFIADQPEEFANLIVALAQNAGLRRETGNNAMLFIRNNFDNKLLTNRLVEFLQTIDTRR